MVVPFPGINKSLRLRAVFAADVVVNLIVIALGIKRRVNVAKINRFIADELPQNIEVISVIKFIYLVYEIKKRSLL